MTDEEVAVALAEHKKEIGSLKHRMDDVEEIIRAVNTLAISVKELAVNVANSNDRMDAYEQSLRRQGERIGDMEKKSAKRWESIVEKAILAVVAALVGTALAHFGLG